MLYMYSLRDTFCELALVENPRFAVEIVVISVILSEIYSVASESPRVCHKNSCLISLLAMRLSVETTLGVI